MRFKKILIAPDKFKGTLTAAQAARAIERGLRAHAPEIETRLMPIADGGEGTTDAICAALPEAKRISIPARTPQGTPCDGEVAVAGGSAFFEMASAAGLKFVPLAERNPWRVDTRGVGMILRALAALGGVRKIHVGLGGSATNDAGLGMAAALGFRFLDAVGRDVEALPENFGRIVSIARPENHPIAGVEVVALCDVTNPLLGASGASFVYGPQKGLREPERMDEALARIADIVARDLGGGADFRNVPGAGAAGGLGYGLMTFCGAKLRPGFETIAEVAGIEAAVRDCDLVITGEGRLDSQTLFGKGPAELARLARRWGKSVVAFGGCVEPGAEAGLREVFADICTLSGPLSDGNGAEAALEAAARRFAQAHQKRRGEGRRPS